MNWRRRGQKDNQNIEETKKQRPERSSTKRQEKEKYILGNQATDKIYF